MQAAAPEQPTGQQPVADRAVTGQRPGEAEHLLPLAEAAAAYRTTPEALRMRFRRGSISGRKGPDGRLYIQAPPAGAQVNKPEQPTGQTGQPTGRQPDTDQSLAASDRAAVPDPGRHDEFAERLIKTLEGEVGDLRHRLNEAERGQAELRRLLLQSNQALADSARAVADLSSRIALPPPEPLEGESHPDSDRAMAGEGEQPREPARPSSRWRRFWPWPSR
jgi:hypothetical protein